MKVIILSVLALILSGCALTSGTAQRNTRQARGIATANSTIMQSVPASQVPKFYELSQSKSGAFGRLSNEMVYLTVGYRGVDSNEIALYVAFNHPTGSGCREASELDFDVYSLPVQLNRLTDITFNTDSVTVQGIYIDHGQDNSPEIAKTFEIGYRPTETSSGCSGRFIPEVDNSVLD